MDKARQTIAERCASKTGEEAAKDIVADIRSRMDELALKQAMAAFKAFHASWEGSIIVAIGVYLEQSEAAGYRIIPPGEFDRVSLEAAAEIAEGYAFATAKIDSWGVRFEPNVRTAGSGIATAIRRLAEITA